MLCRGLLALACLLLCWVTQTSGVLLLLVRAWAHRLILVDGRMTLFGMVDLLSRTPPCLWRSGFPAILQHVDPSR